MRNLFHLAFVPVLVISAGAQGDADVTRQAAEVKVAVSRLSVAKRPTLSITLRTLATMEAVLISVSEDSFAVAVKKMPDWSKDRVIHYSHVLAISGPGIAVSFVPDPASTPYGTWADVQGIGQNQNIGIVLASGKDMHGRFGGATETEFTLLGATYDAVLEIPRASIVRVFGMNRGRSGVKEYTLKGLKSGSQVGAPEALVTMPVFAGIGALFGLAKQKGESIILVYSK